MCGWFKHFLHYRLELAMHGKIVGQPGAHEEVSKHDDLFHAALDAISEDGELPNRGLKITLLENGEIAVDRYPLPVGEIV